MATRKRFSEEKNYQNYQRVRTFDEYEIWRIKHSPGLRTLEASDSSLPQMNETHQSKNIPSSYKISVDMVSNNEIISS